MATNRLAYVSRVLYKLKRSYGLPITLSKLTNSSVNAATGVKSDDFESIDIEQAIVVRAREFRSFVYDLAYISANKDFTQGGYFDPEDRKVIIDAIDIPSTWTIEIGHFLVFDAQQYTIKELLTVEDGRAYVIIARRVRGEFDILGSKSNSVLILSQTTSASTINELARSVKSELTISQTLYEVP